MKADNYRQKIQEYYDIFFNGTSYFYQRALKVVEINLKNELLTSQSTGHDVTHLWLELYGLDKEPQRISFDKLTLEEKLKIIGDILKRSEMLNQSLYAKDLTTQKNSEWIESFYENGKVDKNIPINILNKLGIAIHGTKLNDLSGILRDGNISGECIVEKSKLDSAPFNVDCSEVNEEILNNPEKKQNQKSIFNSLGGTRYGDGLVLVYRNTQEQIKDWHEEKVEFEEVYSYDLTSWPELTKREKKKIVGGGEHTGVLGAIPATEISAVILNREKISKDGFENYFNQVRLNIVFNGFYVPVLDNEGHLLFSREDYDALIKEYKIYENISESINDDDFYQKVLTKKYNEKFPKLLKNLNTMEGQGGVHKFTKQEHMQKAVGYVDQINKKYNYNLPEKYLYMVKLAAKLHDIGKTTGGVQLLDNTTIASEIIKKSIKGLTEADSRLILLLIREDELLGQLLQQTNLDVENKLLSTNNALKEKFFNLFKSNDSDYSEKENAKLTEIYRKMMICLFKSDIMAIDDGKIYQKDRWAIDEKLKTLGLG